MKQNERPQPDVEAAKTPVQTSNLPIPKYVNPAGEEYPIIAVNGILYPTRLNTTEEDILEQLQTVKSCGFNATTWICRGIEGLWRNQISMYYRVAASLGLPTIYMLQNQIPKVKHKPSESSQSDDTTYDPSLDTLAEIFNLNKDEKNLWGYKLSDEPGFNMWGYTTPTAAVGTEDLCAMYRTYLQNANGHIGYVTLPVVAARKYVGDEIYNIQFADNIKYERYLRAVKDRLNPALLSVDIYPVLEYSSENGECVDMRGVLILSRYYYMIEVIGNFSTDTNIPFWMYILSSQFNINYEGSEVIKTKFPFPTEGILRFQAMTALAYGFQGVAFWTYTLNTTKSEEESSSNEKFLLAPYNYNDEGDVEISDIWYNCAAVIPEIKLYGKILINAKFIEARHVYGPEYLKNKFPITSEFVSYMGCVAYATASGRGFVITRLDKGADKYVAVVSHDPNDYQDITLTLCAGCRWTEYKLLDSSDNYLVETVHERKEYEELVNFTLKPGGIMLIKYEWV